MFTGRSHQGAFHVPLTITVMAAFGFMNNYQSLLLLKDSFLQFIAGKKLLTPRDGVFHDTPQHCHAV